MAPSLQDKRCYFLVKKVRQAQKQFDLIQEGDTIGVGVSGGKDSIALALLLQKYQRTVPFHFEFFLVNLLWDFEENLEQKRQQLENFFHSQQLKIEFIIGNYNIVPPHQAVSPCFACSWNRRKFLFEHCYARGWNKLALGHHLDDAAETSLMNLCFHSTLETMLPKVSFFGGKITLIRPLIMTPEKELVFFGKTLNFPFFGCSCAKKEPSQRDHAGDILRSFGHLATRVKQNIWRASLQYSQHIRQNHTVRDEV